MARLGDVFVLIRNGASIKQTEGAGGIPITRIETISNREVDRNKFGYAGIQDIQKYGDYILQDGDILMSHINSEKHLGKAAIYRAKENEQIIHGMNLLMLRADFNIINPKYALYYFETLPFQQQIMRITKKSVNQASFTVTALKDIEIPLLPLETQRDVVGVLDKVSSLISLRKRQLAKLDELIKARFVEMFGDPRYNTRLFPCYTLGELGKWSSGGTPSRLNAQYFEGTIDWYSAGELDSLFLTESIEKITREAIDNSSAKIFSKGGLLIGMYDTAAFKMGILTRDSACNQACACIEPNEKINVIWLYYELLLMKDFFLCQRRGVRQKNLNLGMIKKFLIPVADLEGQRCFSSFVRQMDTIKLTIQQSLNKLEVLKKSLMQKYF